VKTRPGENWWWRAGSFIFGSDDVRKMRNVSDGSIPWHDCFTLWLN